MKTEEASRTLKAKLLIDNGVDYLEVEIGTTLHRLDINNENGQEQTKAMFCDLVKLLGSTAVKIEHEIEAGYDNTLLIEVSQSCIHDLNNELDVVRETILEDEDYREE